jgi:hypothetical protein
MTASNPPNSSSEFMHGSGIKNVKQYFGNGPVKIPAMTALGSLEDRPQQALESLALSRPNALPQPPPANLNDEAIQPTWIDVQNNSYRYQA